MSEYVHNYQAGPIDDRGDIQFLSRLHYQDFDKNLWEYTSAFGFRYKGIVRWIPQHFITDFYSIPRALRWMYPNNQGIYNESSGIHDWTVRNRKLLGLSLVECHYIFNAAMRYQGMSNSRRRIKFIAVYLFNWMSPGAGDGSLPKHVQAAADRARHKTGINYYASGC